MTALVTCALVVLFTVVFAAAWPLLFRLDNRLEADMPLISLTTRIQHWLGLDHIHHALHRQEITMAKVIDLLNSLAAQQTAASAAQATSFHNIDAAFAKLQQAIADGDASPEVQDAANQLSAGFAALQKAADDEAHVYAPGDDNGDQPVDPGNGGDTPVGPPADGGDVPPVVDNAQR